MDDGGEVVLLVVVMVEVVVVAVAFLLLRVTGGMAGWLGAVVMREEVGLRSSPTFPGDDHRRMERSGWMLVLKRKEAYGVDGRIN